MQKLVPANETLAINTVTVLSRCSPTADSSVSTLTRPPSVPAGGAAVLPVLPEGVEDIVPAPLVLEEGGLMVGTRSTANELRRLGDQSRRTGWIRSRITI